MRREEEVSSLRVANFCIHGALIRYLALEHICTFDGDAKEEAE